MDNKLVDLAGLRTFWSKIKDKLSAKVDKVQGMGLSENNLTGEMVDENRQAFLHSQTQHAPQTAQENVIECVAVNRVPQSVAAKTVDIQIPLASQAAPMALGEVTAGTGEAYAREDHVHRMPTCEDIGAVKSNTDAFLKSLEMSGNLTIDRGAEEPDIYLKRSVGGVEYEPRFYVSNAYPKPSIVVDLRAEGVSQMGYLLYPDTFRHTNSAENPSFGSSTYRWGKLYAQDLDITNMGAAMAPTQSRATRSGYRIAADGYKTAWGTVTITPTAANTYTVADITYPVTFLNTPNPMVNCRSGNAYGTVVLGCNAINTTATGFQISIIRTNTGATGVDWFVEGY